MVRGRGRVRQRLDPEVARLYADTVYRFLGSGLKAAGVTVAPQEVHADLGAYARTADLNATAAVSPDYPNGSWVAASTSNYVVSNRPTSNAIDRVVIHMTQGSYAGTISWFQNPSSRVSSHYVVRSSDGAVTQMVRNKDVAWHASNYNTRSIGIEHEGFVNDASWFTDAMYRSSAALTRYICDRYGIPKDRNHIIGHNQVPGATHRPGLELGLDQVHAVRDRWRHHPSVVVGHRRQRHRREVHRQRELGHLRLLQPAERRRLPIRRPGVRQRLRLVPGGHPHHGHVPRRGLVSVRPRLQQLRALHRHHVQRQPDGVRRPALRRRWLAQHRHLLAQRR
ncbi:N-acetylmuramoyl-L-alanine amidase [Streptosporangium lutulentum]